MDIENELEQFKKHNTPALVGSSVRGGEETESHPSSRSSSRPVIKNTQSRNNIVTLADLRAEGGLIDDSEGQLEEILDNAGHIKSEVLSDDVTILPRPTPRVDQMTEDDSDDVKVEDHHMNVYGGNGDEFVVPASGLASGYKYDGKKKKKCTPVSLVQEMDLIPQERVKSVDDILEEVNTGKSGKSTAQDDLSKMMKDIQGLDFELGDEHEVQQDSEFIAPAARREGSSASVTPSATPTDSRGRSIAREGSGIFKPHLARGDSYHGGLNDENIHHPVNSSTQAGSERKPRHDPNVRPGITNSSSLSYLRTISRSRSRMANDKKALGEDLSLDQLRESGGLINESTEENANGPNFEDAVKTAMEFVDNSHHIKNVKRNVSDLKEVDEGNEASQRGRGGLNGNDDLLDELAHSAKELMLTDDEQEEENEPLHEEGKSEDADDVTVDDVTVIPEADGADVKEFIGTDDILEPTEKSEVEEETGETEESPAVEEKETTTASEVLDEEDTCDSEEEEQPLNLKTAGDDEETDDTNTQSNEDESAEKVEDDVDEDDIEAIIAAAMAEQAKKGRSFDKTDELAVLVSGAVKEEKDKADFAEFDTIVAAVAKERALKDVTNPMGTDGSVFVPKASGKMTFEDEPVYLYTSLAGGFQIHNRMNRMITILTVNKIPYTIRDLGTDEEAKSIWRRFCSGKTLPGIVRGKDDFIGNWEDVEEANENYAIKSLIYESF